MIVVSISTNSDKRECSLRLKGHAGYAEQGKDIVCASASILACTLASIVDSFDDVESVIDLVEGDTTIECQCKDEQTFIGVKNAYYYTVIGYALLQHHYPQYVRLNALT